MVASNDVVYRIPVPLVCVETGERNSKTQCAIAQALRMAGMLRPEVNNESGIIAFTDPRKNVRVYFRMTGKETTFIGSFDNDDDPGELELLFLKSCLIRIVEDKPGAPRAPGRRKGPKDAGKPGTPAEPRETSVPLRTAGVIGTGKAGTPAEPREPRATIRRSYRPSLTMLPVPPSQRNPT